MLTVNSFQSNRGWFVNNLFHLLGILCARSNAKNFPFIFLLNSFCHPVSFAFWGNWSLERWKSLCTAQLQGLRLPHNVSNLKAITFNHCSILPRKTQTVFWWMKGWRKVNQGDRKQASREQPHAASVKCLTSITHKDGFSMLGTTIFILDKCYVHENAMSCFKPRVQNPATWSGLDVIKRDLESLPVWVIGMVSHLYFQYLPSETNVLFTFCSQKTFRQHFYVLLWITYTLLVIGPGRKQVELSN